MKQIPLNQPHATLVSLGIQTVVTSNHRIEPGTRIAVKANKTPVDRTRWERVLSPNVGRAWDVALGAFPFGVVVCTAVVTDCLPINSTSWGQATSYIQTSPSRVNDLILRWDLTDDIRREWHSTDLSDQLPYCDWTKRWAWLLADIEHDIECPKCDGAGGEPVENERAWWECPRCGGSGRLALPLDPKDMP